MGDGGDVSATSNAEPKCSSERTVKFYESRVKNQFSKHLIYMEKNKHLLNLFVVQEIET